MRPYGSKDSDSIQAVKSCVDDFRRGRRPVSGVAGWLSRPEWAGVGVLVAIALVAVPAVWRRFSGRLGRRPPSEDRKSTRLNSSHVANSYAVFCLKQKTSRHG